MPFLFDQTLSSVCNNLKNNHTSLINFHMIILGRKYKMQGDYELKYMAGQIHTFSLIPEYKLAKVKD